MSSDDYAYLISNIFGTYTIFKFMCVFFERGKVKRIYEIASYFVYFFVVSYVYLMIQIPIFTLLTNIGAFFLLTFNYKTPMKKRFISTIYMYVILMSVESIIVILTGFLDLSLFNTNSTYSSIAGYITIKIISYIVVLLIQNYKNVKKGFDVPNSYWFSLFLIPLGTLYVTLLIFENGNLDSFKIILCISILFIINVVAFYLYDVLVAAFEDKFEKALLRQQNNYYLKQFEIMDNSYQNVKSIRHDIKNHIIILESYINNDDKEKALSYIKEIVKASYYDKEVAKSGNIEFDSILNYKLQTALMNNIKVNVNLKIPEKLHIASFDIIIILGNLLDNALEAVSKIKENKKIQVRISYRKNILFIHVSNTFNGTVIYENNKISTSNEDKEKHGIGLNNIEKVIKKYDGTMEINHTSNSFKVEILMYIH